MKGLFSTWRLGLAALLCAAGVGLGAPDARAQDAGMCVALARARLDGAQAVTASLAAADPAHGLPAFCEVKATLSAGPGSRIGVVYRLPAGWNGKLLGLGGGGQAGNVTLAAATPGLKRGYATAQTDGGHPNPNGGDNSWALLPDGKPDMAALEDFGHRAIHLMTVAGKQVVADYYGRGQTHAYYQGCSTGGRQGLMEVQRYPDDYDGVIAGAPVYSLRVQAAEIYHENLFSAPGAALLPAQIGLIQQASLAACDAADGLKDGIVTDPRACRFDPAALLCKAGAAPPECLTGAQVAALRKAYTPVRTADGQVAVFGLGPGNEAGWKSFTRLTADEPSRNVRRLPMREIYFGDAAFDLSKLDPARDVPKMRQSALARVHEAANPDISRFVRRGGKLILWHGFDDPGPSPHHTIELWDATRARTGNLVGADRFAAAARFYLAPGVWHCGGGPGPDQFDLLSAMEGWIEHGTPPERITASKVGSPIRRPLCPYPALPRYDGRGEVNDERSFACR